MLVISTFIAENFRLVQAALLVGSLGCIALVVVLVRSGRTGRRVATVLAAVSVLCVLGLTLWPDTDPLGEISCSFDASYFYRDERNIVLFFFPALFSMVAMRRPLLVFASGIALSVLIEVVQALTPALGRICDIGDLLANTSGAAAGVLVALLVAFGVRRWG